MNSSCDHNPNEGVYMHRYKVSILLVTVMIPLITYAESEYCTVLMKNPIFTKTTIISSTETTTNFRKMLCSASWSSAEEAQSAGVEATIPIYGLKLPLSANWDNHTISEWKTNNCSEEERNGDFKSSFYKVAVSIDPVTAKAYVDCIRVITDSEKISSLKCSINETQNFIMFESRWKRMPGEALDTAPVITQFTATNADCQNPNIFGAGQKVQEGGIATICNIKDLSAGFSLNTNRGSCFIVTTPRLPKIVLPASFILNEPKFISGTDIEIPAEAKIVTNGKPLTIMADRLTIGSGSKIISFEPSQPSLMQAGKYSSLIKISAKEVIGKGLSVLNAGSTGGNGSVGPDGAPGNPGAPGKPRTTEFTNACKNILGDFGGQLCGLVPSGCGGGENGTQGGKGMTGYQGMPGMPGGGAGQVIIDIPLENRDAISVLTNVDVSGESRDCNGLICGGKGGLGGPGGKGGLGGSGGEGAGGTTYCGGTNRGEIGPMGDMGTQGSNGSDGPNQAPEIY